MPNAFYGQNNPADSVAIPSLTLSGDFSICLQANFDDVTSVDGQAIAGNLAGFTNYLYLQFYATTTQCVFKNSAGSGVNATSSTAGWITAGEWHSIVIVRTIADSSLRVYVDNVLGITITSASVLGDFVVDQLLRLSDDNRPWRSKIFDLQIFGTAIDSGQRVEVGSFAPVTGATRERWHQMQLQHATAVPDSSGNGQHGTLSFADFEAWHYTGPDVPHDYNASIRGSRVGLGLGLALTV